MPDLSQVELFISYRKTDTAGAAKILHGELGPLYGEDRVFRDAERHGILPGDDFGKRILAALSTCEVVLFLIGRNWLVRRGWRRRLRLSEPDDWVRRELLTAEERERIIIPVLVNGAALPRERELPRELRFLLKYNAISVDFGSREGLDRLLSRVKLLCPPQRPAGKEEALLDTAAGAPWSPQEPLHPHRFDYKLCVPDEANRQNLRRRLFRAQTGGREAETFRLEDFREIGEFRKFVTSQNKLGLFIQASALVTAGGAFDEPERVLVAHRADRQAHQGGGGKNLSGTSCLVSTPLASFDFLDAAGHCPTILFGGARDGFPLALFQRKLLIPLLAARSRFRGIGFNLGKEGKEYVFVVWQVHLDSPDQVMVVRDRDGGGEDRFVWVRREELKLAEFDKAVVDRLVAKRVVLGEGPGEETGFSGFLTGIGFERVAPGQGPQPVHTGDLFELVGRIYQQKLHQGELEAPVDVATLAGSVLGFAVAFLEGYGCACRVTEEPRPVPGFAGWLAAGIEVAGAGREVAGLMFGFDEAAENPAPAPPFGESGGGGERRRLIFRGVASNRRYMLQGEAGEAGPEGGVREFRLACLRAGAEAGVICEVSHAVILCGLNGAGPEEVFMVHEKEDEPALWKLPGGKVEEGESPEAALYRELMEELGLPRQSVARLEPLPPAASNRWGEFTEQAVSPRTGELTDYRFSPMIVHLTESGRRQLWERVNQPEPTLRPIRLEDWERSGFGYSAIYPKMVCEAIRERFTRGGA